MKKHVLLESTDEMKGDARLKPAAFHPASQLPEQLPEGAHRVIKELTSAKMREMMRGIVIEGTGRSAQLNGYSSGGKTGTAQKIDPATHTYSHTKLVASFAGMAPVSNPAITVAVIIDTPQGSEAQRYGAYVSAPVFASVAQQVLEYLGVPHDQPLKTKKEMLAAVDTHDVFDTPAEVSGADLNAMFAQINDLPADDPLRAANDASPVATSPPQPSMDSATKQSLPEKLSDRVLAAFHAHGDTTSSMPDANEQVAIVAPKIRPVEQTRGSGIVVDTGQRVAVPSFEGAALRGVVERAGAAGLRVEPIGSGLAREQAPAAGTMVPPGTEVVVRFAR